MLEVPYTTGYLTEHFADPEFATLEGYERRGGYSVLRKVLKGVSPADVVETVKSAGLQLAMGDFDSNAVTQTRIAFRALPLVPPSHSIGTAEPPSIFSDRADVER